MSNNRKWGIFNKLKKFLKDRHYFSPSYYYYMVIEIKKENNSDELEFKEMKRRISESMKYFFYFIDLVFISLILCKNTIHILEKELISDKVVYVSITFIAIFLLFYCIYKIDTYVDYGTSTSDKMDLVDKIIKRNYCTVRDSDSWYRKIKINIKIKIAEISLRKTINLGIIIVFIGVLALLNEKIKIVVAIISIFYFLMRPVHYCVVFLKDFKNKISRRMVDNAEQKMRYITLSLLNYVKIILEFCILIYLLKYMGWAFVNIEINTFFELLYTIVLGDLKASTSIEMFINLLRIATLGMVITLNLATYMSLEIKGKDNAI